MFRNFLNSGKAHSSNTRANYRYDNKGKLKLGESLHPQVNMDLGDAVDNTYAEDPKTLNQLENT